LYTQKAETDVPDIPKAEFGFLHEKKGLGLMEIFGNLNF
jgi:hypothetical protein